MEEYLAGLDRAMKSMPATRETKERFVIPPARVFYEGKTTVLENFGAIADTLNRDPEHLMKYLLQEMGTAGKIEGQRGVFSGKFSEQAIARQIESYFEEYVVCTECRLPDTHLTKSDRVLMLKCDACGAHRPVRKRKAIATVQKDMIEEGETYELRIESVGNKGDGIAKVDKYLIFVPSTVKGEIVKAKIKKISGTLAFAEVVERVVSHRKARNLQMDEKITLTFTENHKYQLEFSPAHFWMAFAKSYGGLPWIEKSEERVAIVAENYSYLLDLLVQARLYHLSTMPQDEHFQ